MRRIKYPERGTPEFRGLLDDYIKIYKPQLTSLETEWNKWKFNHSVVTIPESVAQLIVADTDVLADVYHRFISLGINEKEPDPTGKSKRNIRSSAFRDLDSIFHYSKGYDSDIANFFMDKAELLHITACHYCELSYINVYGRKKRHFDLDHFFPESKCPILALSLFNFVPSCQVCNSRIKSIHLLGGTIKEWTEFNPASKCYSFNENVRTRLRMYRLSTSFTDKMDYYIHFRCKNGFRASVDFFHLEERYDFHRIVPDWALPKMM